jgi:hypothetical protein
MSTALWGVLSALGWGSADFIARFTGRKLGITVALFGMIAVGAVALTVAVLAVGWGPDCLGASRCKRHCISRRHFTAL